MRATTMQFPGSASYPSAHRALRTSAVLAALMIGGCSCGRARPENAAPAPTPTVSEAPTPPEPVAAEAETESAAAEPPPPLPRIETPRFTVTAESVGSRYARGRSGKLAFEVHAQDGYTIHATLPLHVTVRAPAGMGVEKSTFERADAAVATPTRARFEVPVRPTQTGEANVDALVRFAICQGEVCEPHDERVMVSLTVE